jgi:glycosyltransferase involved in cell wall biosynthesis
MENPFQPIRIIDIELSRPLGVISAWDESSGKSYRRAYLFARLCGYPLGFVETGLEDTLSGEEYAGLIWQELSGPANRFLQRNGLAPVDALTAAGLSLPGALPVLEERKKILAAAPRVCVILCTRDRTATLARSIKYLLAMDYPNFEVLVVDNAPGTAQTADYIRETYAGCPQVRYVCENRPGLSWARNCGLQNTQAEIVAYIDDDEIADPNWLAELVVGFKAAAQVACVTGAIIPAEIETQPQYWFEQYGGHSKGRGFDRFIFNTRMDRTQSALFPNPPFGAGGNMAFDAAILRRLGGFDTALGAGTLARGGEDTAAFFHVLRKGYQLVFSPAALVRHFHYRDYNSLKKQFYGYGVGLTAFYTHCILKDPGCIFELVRQVPKAVAFIARRKKSPVVQEEALPEELIRTKMNGLLRGPFDYLKSLQVAKRIE